MLRKCIYCGKEFESTDRRHVACPSCVVKNKKSTLMSHVCAQCGTSFVAGPSSTLCPACREKRKREQQIEYQKRKRKGLVQKIGSTSKCERCGKEYIREGGRQKYCKDCSAQAIRENDRIKSKEWNKEHGFYERRLHLADKQDVMIPCVVCGKMFVSRKNRITCSDECRRERNNQKVRESRKRKKEKKENEKEKGVSSCNPKPKKELK